MLSHLQDSATLLLMATHKTDRSSGNKATEQSEDGLRQALDIAHSRRICTQGMARTLRLAAGLSLRDVANAAGVSEASVSRWEREHRGPSNPRAAEALGQLYRRLAQ